MMRKAEVIKYNEPLVIRECPIPDPPPQGLVIKTSYAGICHSDIHIWEDIMDMGDGKALRMGETIGPNHLPLVMGHEIAGIVHSLGAENDEEADQSIKLGDRVILYPWMGCGACGVCKGPSPQKCPIPINTLGVVSPGGYATHVSIKRKKHVLKIPDNVPLDAACMFTCSALTTYNAADATKEILDDLIKINGKSTLMIIGAGGLGLWCIQMAKAILPSGVKIISADISKEKLEMAIKHGADAIALWNKDMTDEEAAKAVLEAAGARSIDAVCDFVGSGQTVKRALDVVSKAGVVVPVGLFGGKLEVGVPSVVVKSITIAAKYVGSLPQMAAVVKLAAEGKIVSPPIIHYSLDQINDALTTLRNGQMKGRGVIDFVNCNL